jgi:hypothetical protein
VPIKDTVAFIYLTRGTAPCDGLHTTDQSLDKPTAVCHAVVTSLWSGKTKPRLVSFFFHWEWNSCS